MALVIDIKVVPVSGRRVCELDRTGKLKCYLKSAPERGKANDELVKFFAKSLCLRADQVTIMLGASSRTKRLCIEADITPEALFSALGIVRQIVIGETR